jgi:hypothetical protein
VLGVSFGFATMLIAGSAGVAALLLTYPYIAALTKWAGIAYLLFIAWQLAQPHRQATRKELNPTGLKPLLFLAVRCLSVRQSESMDARCGYRRIVHGEQCARRQYRHYCDCVFRSPPLAALSLGPGWAPRCETGLASVRECAFLQTSRWACSSPPPQYGWRCYEGHAITSPGNRR